jgi:hypothetical protein
MQLFLQPITEQYCERFSLKCVHYQGFASTSSILGAGKGCELRGLLISLAT